MREVSRVAGLANSSPQASKLARLNRTVFRVLRCVAVVGLAIFCARVSDISLKIPILSGFRSHTDHVFN